MRWLQKAESFFAKTHTPPTPKTPKRAVMGVLGVPPLGIPEKTHVIDSCRFCAHHRRPGIGNRYCGGRPDLPLAYGPGHPLRRLPADLGDSCQSFEVAEAYR